MPLREKELRKLFLMRKIINFYILNRNKMEQFNLKRYLKNPNEIVVTRSGANVRIVCTNRKSKDPRHIVALIDNIDCEEMFAYTKYGKIIPNVNSSYDLFFKN